MSLNRLMVDFAAWLNMVLIAFQRVKRRSALSIVFMSLVSRVFTLMAFILPLKVIILAGSDGVPKYFNGLIDYQDKGAWILALSVAAFGFYVMCLFLDFLVDAEVTSGARKVIDTIGSRGGRAPELAKVKVYYSSVWQILADTFFVVVCLIVISMLNAVLLFALFFLVLIEYFATAYLLRKAAPVSGSWLSGLLHSDFKAYLSIFVSLNFLLGFVVIVSPFLLGMESEILLSIVSLIVCRQLLTALGQLINGCVRLGRSKDRIEALAYELRDQSVGEEFRSTKNLVFLSDQERRNSWFREMLSGTGLSIQAVESAWVDFHIQKMFVFLVRALQTGSAHEQCFQVQVFDSARKSFYDNESALFDLVGRRQLHAPERLISLDEAGICWQVLQIGRGEFVSDEGWEASFRDVLIQHWSVEPPKKLLSQFSSSSQLIQEKFSDDFFSCLRLAVTSDSERSDLARFFSYLPRIREILCDFPLYVHNPDIRLGNVFHSEGDNCYCVMSWGRWSLEPIGARLPVGISSVEVNEMICRARQGRDDIPSGFGVAHIRFAAKFYKIVSWVDSGKYGAALAAMQEVLDSPIITAESSDVLFA